MSEQTHHWSGVDVMDRDQALKLAIDAINNDPRREPYGHHQHGRERAIRALRALLENT